MTRRRFGAPSLAVLVPLMLSAAGALGLAVTAGCAANGEDGSGNAPNGNGSGGASGSGNGGSGATNVSGSAGEGSYQDDQGCKSVSKVANVVPPNIMFLVDSSGSMAFDSPSRWSVLKPEIVKAIDTLPDESGVGIIYFPGNPADNECLGDDVAVPMSKLGPGNSLTGHREKVSESLLSTQPNGGTPTHDGFHFARVQVETEKESGVLEGNWFIIMVTDGEATEGRYCSSTLTNMELIEEVRESATDFGVKTFVIGAPGSEGSGSIDDDFRPVLSAMAKAGGMAPATCFTSTEPYCHYDLTNTNDLGASLEEALAVITGAITCELAIPAPPDGEVFDEERVKMILTDNAGTATEIPWDKTATGTCPAGNDAFWIYSSDKQSIILCGSACANAKAVTDGRLDVSFGCKAVLR